MKINFLFTERDDKYKDRIKSIVSDMEALEMGSLPFYYGRCVVNFLETTTQDKVKECFREINVAMLFSLLDWMSLPKYAKAQHNDILIKTQCLLELEEGNKIKEETVLQVTGVEANHEAMTKVVQSIFNEINTWRERLPHKFENMGTWRSILEQRSMIFRHLRKRMQSILDPILTSINSTESAEKLLIPYQDIEWNSLMMIKQQRNFGVYSIKDYKTPDDQLYYDEVPIKNKELYFFNVDALKNYETAKAVLDRGLNTVTENSFRIDYQRLKANLLSLNGDTKEASNLFQEIIKSNEDEAYSLFKDWLIVCFKGYEESTGSAKLDWVKNALSILPHALKYNPKQTRI